MRSYFKAKIGANKRKRRKIEVNTEQNVVDGTSTN